MPFPLYIAGRYTISKSKNNAVNIITRIAAVAIVVSTAALFIIMSVFAGLKDFSLSFANDTDPDLKVFASAGKSFTVSPEKMKQLDALKGIAAKTFVAEERVLFYYNEKEEVAFMKGVDSLYNRVTPMNDPKRLLGGEWILPYSGQAVVGAGIYNKLSLGLYNVTKPLEVFVPKAGKGMITENDFNKEQLMVVGVYSINEDIDNRYVYCSLDLAQKLLEFKRNQYTAIELKMKPGTDEAALRESIEAIFKGTVSTKNRAQLNDSLYKMLNAENLVTYLFCSLVVVLTLFCLAGALIMLILDKRENIKTLHCLGAEVKSLRNIFFLQGIFITAIGAFIGLLLGLGFVLAQQQFSLIMITPTMPYPTAVTLTNVAIVLATIFILGIGASRIAAGRVNAQLLEG
ncbi:ABC transporter permease [Flavobacterium sp. RHBU_24]|uniref:ABC transporter permease n=1 Tax=Flavobacterium sp. RHBU_24 TaxID=3391185 RepID=UPI0039851089